MNAPQDRELDRLLDASANVIGWDDPAARARLLQAIRDEPRCTDHTCPDCYPTEDEPMTNIETWLKLGKAAVWVWAIAAALFLVAAMVFGQDLP
jgi:hypothetical protein